MKLFVWNNPYSVIYGSSLVFAVAETVEAGRVEAEKGLAYTFGEYLHSNPGARLGEPTRVLDIPCAEWHEWSE